MTKQNTVYIAEPIFSDKLQEFDSDCSFPPIKKIGITTDFPERRERELLGTVSPVKISIVKAWTSIDARAVELMLHTILDNTRLDGEFFWDGNETLVDAVTNFIEKYHSEAEELVVPDDKDVQAASDAAQRTSSRRMYSEVSPELDKLGIDHKVAKDGRNVHFKLGDYKLRLGARTGGRYTLTIFSDRKSTEQAMIDYPGSQELSGGATGESNRRARISQKELETIIDALRHSKKTA